MENRKLLARLALIGVVAVVFAMLLPPLPKPKASAMRIRSLNRVATVSAEMPSTSAAPRGDTNN